MGDNKIDKNNYTYEEILNQTKALEAAYNDIIERCTEIDFLKKPYDELIFFGCGTDYNLSLSTAFVSKSLMKNKSFIVLPSSELSLHTDTYINKDKKYL